MPPNWLAFDWSPIIRFGDDEERKKIFENIDYDRAGIYRIIALSTPANDAKPAHLSRICAQDEAGTLYIGYSGNVRDRIGIATNKSSSYRKLPDILSAQFPFGQLAVSWSYADSAREASDRGSQLVNAYVRRFGEPPPFNG